MRRPRAVDARAARGTGRWRPGRRRGPRSKGWRKGDRIEHQIANLRGHARHDRAGVDERTLLYAPLAHPGPGSRAAPKDSIRRPGAPTGRPGSTANSVLHAPRRRVEEDPARRVSAEAQQPGQVELQALAAVSLGQHLIGRAGDPAQAPVVLDQVDDRGLVSQVVVDRVDLGEWRDDQQRQPRAKPATALLAARGGESAGSARTCPRLGRSASCR